MNPVENALILAQQREHREAKVYFFLSLVFFISALGVTIAIAWNMNYWFQLVITDVLLLIAGAACKGGRT